MAEIPQILPLAKCVRSQSLLACHDRRGNYWSVLTQGNSVATRGFDAASGQRWAQTVTRFGRWYFFSGLSSAGQIWVGSSRTVGWNVLTRLSSSTGDRGAVMCNRVAGCSMR